MIEGSRVGRYDPEFATVVARSNIKPALGGISCWLGLLLYYSLQLLAIFNLYCLNGQTWYIGTTLNEL